MSPPVDSVPIKELQNRLFFSGESSEFVELDDFGLIFDTVQNLCHNNQGSHNKGGEDSAA